MTYKDIRDAVEKELNSRGFTTSVPVRQKYEKENILLVSSANKTYKVKTVYCAKPSAKFMIPKRDENKIDAYVCLDVNSTPKFYIIKAADAFKRNADKIANSRSCYTWSGDMKSILADYSAADENNYSIFK